MRDFNTGVMCTVADVLVMIDVLLCSANCSAGSVEDIEVRHTVACKNGLTRHTFRDFFLGEGGGGGGGGGGWINEQFLLKI